MPPLVVDADEAVAQARRHRPAFVNLDLESVEAERELVRARRNSGFSATLQASYGLNQRSDAFDGVYNNPLNQQQFTINFSVPIFRWGLGQANVAAAVARQQQADRDASRQRDRAAMAASPIVSCPP